MTKDMRHWQVIDALNGSLLREEYLQELVNLGVLALHITVNNFRKINPYPSLIDAMVELAHCRKWLAQVHEKVELITTISDLDRAGSAHKVGIILGYQNMPGIGTAVELLPLFHTMGVRIIQLTHNNRNLIGDGCDEPSNAGLSKMGRRIVEEMNRLGIVIDLSHVGEATCLQVLEQSTQPVAITHSNVKALVPNARNKSDRVLDALGANGGVIGVTFLPPLVSRQGCKSTVDDVIAQVEYIAGRIGCHHIGIGSDFIAGQPSERYVEFLRHPEIYGEWPWQFPIAGMAHLDDLFTLLLRRGYKEDDVRGIAGLNFRHLFEKGWSKTECF